MIRKQSVDVWYHTGEILEEKDGNYTGRIQEVEVNNYIVTSLWLPGEITMLEHNYYNWHYNCRIFYKNQNDIQRPNIFKDRLFDKVQKITGIVMRQNIRTRVICACFIYFIFFEQLCIIAKTFPKVQSNANSANLMPHDIADLGRWCVRPSTDW